MILVGIDPGTATTGFGVVEKTGDRVRFVDCGTFETPAGMDAPLRLKMIYEDFNTLLDKYRPEAVATERLFFTNNVTTGIPVGRALGVILLTLAQRGLPWAEYTPTQVKSAVVGRGPGRQEAGAVHGDAPAGPERHAQARRRRRRAGSRHLPRPLPADGAGRPARRAWVRAISASKSVRWGKIA